MFKLTFLRNYWLLIFHQGVHTQVFGCKDFMFLVEKGLFPCDANLTGQNWQKACSAAPPYISNSNSFKSTDWLSSTRTSNENVLLADDRSKTLGEITRIRNLIDRIC